MGFGSFRRDEFESVNDTYYSTTHKVKINLTGLEIEEIKYSLGYRNFNPNKSKTKLLDVLDSFHKLIK
jgi:hypothetical protein